MLIEPALMKVDPRIERTRTMLETAFRQLISETHYSEISVQDIARLAGVNRTTFYAHYEDKSHIASLVLKTDLEKELFVRFDCDSELDSESLYLVTLGVFEFFYRTIGSCPQSATDFWPNVGIVLQQALESFVMRWLDMKPINMKRFSGSHPVSVASMISWTICGAAFEWVGKLGEGELRQAAKNTSHVILSGR